MVEWKKLGEVCEVMNGFAFRSQEYVPKGIRVIRISDVQSGFISDKDKVFYPKEKLSEFERYMLNYGDLVMSLTGNPGRVAFIHDESCALNQRVACLRSKNIKNSFLFYLFNCKEFEKIAFANSTGGAQKNLSTTWLNNYLIPIPSLSEQERIVGILDTFTAGIENIKEQIAQRRKQYEYYRDELLDLEGKEGVEMNTLGEICSRITDGSHFSPQAVEHGYYMPSVKDMTSNGFDYSSCKQISNEDYENLVNNGCKPKINDVLIAKDGSMLKYVFPIVEEKDIVVLSSIAILTPKQGIINSQFLSYFLLQQKIKEKTIREFSSKGGVPRIILKNFKKVNVMYPSLSEQQRIVSILDTFEDSIQNLEAQLEQRQKQYEYYRNKLLTFE